jgi:hypothetical protein
MLSIFIPWQKTPLIPPLKMTIKVIYSPGIKVFYAGVVFDSKTTPAKPYSISKTYSEHNVIVP